MKGEGEKGLNEGKVVMSMKREGEKELNEGEDEDGRERVK